MDPVNARRLALIKLRHAANHEIFPVTIEIDHKVSTYCDASAVRHAINRIDREITALNKTSKARRGLWFE
jgi:hypothetical protein